MILTMSKISLLWNIIISLSVQSSWADEIHLITYEAPPFISQKLPEQGAAIYALRTLLKKSHTDLKITLTPFLRARQIVHKDDSASGYFPVTQINVAPEFSMSNVIFRTPWVFAEHKDKPVTWKQPTDLIPYRIGNAAGYDIVEPFRELYDKKKIKVEPAPTDEMNLLKLANKRVDVVFIDAGMFDYLVKTSPVLKPHKDKLRINAKVIQVDQYGVAFKRTPLAMKNMEKFNKVVNEDEFTRLVNAYFKKYLQP